MLFSKLRNASSDFQYHNSSIQLRSLINSSWGACVRAVGGQCGLISVSLYLYHWEQIRLISLSSQHLRPDTSDHNQSPSGSPFCYLFLSASQPSPCITAGVSVFVCLLFGVALSLFISEQHLSVFLFLCAVMVHCGNIHCMQRDLVLGGILLLFLYRIVCVCVCVCGCVSESIYKGISPGGVDASLQWWESKEGGGDSS